MKFLLSQPSKHAYKDKLYLLIFYPFDPGPTV